MHSDGIHIWDLFCASYPSVDVPFHDFVGRVISALEWLHFELGCVAGVIGLVLMEFCCRKQRHKPPNLAGDFLNILLSCKQFVSQSFEELEGQGRAMNDCPTVSNSFYSFLELSECLWYHGYCGR
jgi:hypothetical protein